MPNVILIALGLCVLAGWALTYPHTHPLFTRLTTLIGVCLIVAGLLAGVPV